MPFGLHKLKDTVGAGLCFSWQEEAQYWSCRESWALRGWTRVLSLPQQQCRGKVSGPKPGAGLRGAGHGEEPCILWTKGLHAHGSLRLILIAWHGCCCFVLRLSSSICSLRPLRDQVATQMPSSKSIVEFAQTILTITKKNFPEQWF